MDPRQLRICILTMVGTLIWTVGLAPAQIVVRSIVPARLIQATPSNDPFESASQVPTESPPAGSAASPNAPTVATQTPDQILLTQLLAAKFERTPQAMLEAWSFRDPSLTDKQEPESKRHTATVVNQFADVVVVEFADETTLKPQDKIVVIAEDDDQESQPRTAVVVSVEGKTAVTKLDPKSDPKKPAAEKQSIPKPDSSGDASPVPPETDSQAPNNLKTQPADEGSSPQTESKPSDENPAPDPSEPQPSAPNKSDPDQPNLNQSDLNQPKPDQPDPDQPKQVLPPELKPGAKVIISLAPKVENANSIAEKTTAKKVEVFVRDVKLGNWKAVKTFLDGLEPDDAEKVYTHMLTSLAQATPVLPDGIPPEMVQQFAQMQSGQNAPNSFLTPDDILQLTEASPKPIEFEIKKPESEDAKTAAAAPALPPGVSLPEGMTFASLPPEAQAALLAQSGGEAVASGDATSPAAPTSHLPAIANLIRIANEGGHDFAPFVAKLKLGTTHFGLNDRIKRLTTADLLMKSGMTDEVAIFLPSLDDAETQTDLPTLKLWSQFSLNRYQEKKVTEWLDKAWQINQWIVALDEIEKSDRDKALGNLIQLSTQVDEEVGQAWINASFTEEPERGKMILTNLGSKSATQAAQAAMISESERLKLLRLQNEAVENLIKISPEKASEWAEAMTLLAQNWLTEAETSIKYSKQNSRGSFMQIDMYGNYYWVDQDQFMQMRGGSRNPQPIKLGDMLEIMPSEPWREHVSRSLHTQLRKITANLYLRVNEEDKAFPYIEAIAPEHPAIARDLVHEFLRIWTTNHDPNTDKRQRNPYIYFYGFDQKAEAIPLTRSKQQRNLEELSAWVERIRKLNLEDIDEQLLANAFTTCHSSAEVFRLEAVKRVFGDLENLKPESIAAICQKMRVNLSTNWRDVRNQEAKQTNRREPEVQQEVLRGYEVAKSLAAEALTASPENWQLHLAMACLMYDQNAYSQTVQKSSEFSDRRDLAFDQFQTAANKYRDIVPTLEEKDQSTDVFDYWFYAALGACDLGKITDKTVPDLRQYPKIREAIESLPGNLAEIHMAKVANNMFTRMSPIKPEIKFRYLRGGFEIVGDHPRAWEARNLFDYYQDLVHEIKLQVTVDGSEDVGHSQPFGIYVNLLHTSEIEREAGGFAKYVQNQNSMAFAFNYGRPTEDYRDKFTDSVDLALQKHFEILNVTFVGPDAMQSVAAPQAGWRLTPYAYVLLKPRGSEVDRIAPLKLDMDFLDTSGYVVVPVESPAVVIDASREQGATRPIADLEITQTLDERQADESRLILEISASAKGLVPALDDIVDLKRENFEIANIDDQGVLPSSFDKESTQIQILSERSWTVEYRAAEGSGDIAQFSFATAKIPESVVKFQRYEDADLVASEQVVELEKHYGSFSWVFLYWLIPLIGVGLVGIAALVFVLTRPQEVATQRFNVPHDVNPFTVLTLLKEIKHRNGISDEKAGELDASINRVEEFYFGKTHSESSEDLTQLAQQWVHQAK